MNSFIPAKGGKSSIQAQLKHVRKFEEKERKKNKEFHEWAGDNFVMDHSKGLWYKQ